MWSNVETKKDIKNFRFRNQIYSRVQTLNTMNSAVAIKKLKIRILYLFVQTVGAQLIGRKLIQGQINQ